MNTLSLVSVTIGSVFFGGGLLRLVAALLNANTASRVLGEEFMVYADVGTFAVGRHALRLKETKRISVTLMLAALLFMGYEYYSYQVSLVWLIGLLFAAASLRLSTQMIPGCILVLGRSERDTLLLQATINRTLAPFRAISLLQMSESDDETVLRAHSFRLGPNSDWVGAVQTLATFLPLLILDLRDSSDYVDEEVRIILQENYLYKTVFLTSNADSTPLRSRAKALALTVPDDHLVCVSSTEQCIALLRNILFVRRAVPTLENPIYLVRK